MFFICKLMFLTSMLQRGRTAIYDMPCCKLLSYRPTPESKAPLSCWTLQSGELDLFTTVKLVDSRLRVVDFAAGDTNFVLSIKKESR